jgi:hypothetical protein
MDSETIADLIAAAENFYYAWANETGLSYDDDPILDKSWALVERAKRELAGNA